jgi:hypothetical protein
MELSSRFFLQFTLNPRESRIGKWEQKMSIKHLIGLCLFSFCLLFYIPAAFFEVLADFLKKVI